MRRRLILHSCIVMSFATAACGSSDDGTKSSRGSSRVDPTRAVVSIQGVYAKKKTQVTGVVYDARQGLVLTANHAVEGAPSINVTFSDGDVTHARLVARAQCHDLAVLKLFPRPAGLTGLPLARSARLHLGQTVHTLSYLLQSAEGGTPSITQITGTISAVDVREAFPPLPPAKPFIAHQSQLLETAAGSPLLDAQNRLIGINTLVGHPHEPNVPGVEYALMSSYIRKRLGQLRPGVGGAFGGWGAEHSACHAALHKLIGIGHVHPAEMGGMADHH
jgi:S1-C subfamily serine protease